MTHEIHPNDADQATQVLGNEYYQKLQREIRERRANDTVQGRNSGEKDVVEDQRKVTAVVAASDLGVAKSTTGFQDSVQIRSFRWDRGKSGDFELNSKLDPLILTSLDLKDRNVDSLKAIGYKIDLNDRLGQMKQTLMQSVVQSRSSNFFVSKYAEFKVGMLVRLLGLLGISPEELTAIQHQAIEDAIKENIQLMEENIYSLELTELVYGFGKKSRRNLKMFKEVQRQLIAQMSMLGRKEYWSEQRLAEENIRQVRRISEEFQKERDNLMYQYDYYFKMQNG